jgi:transcription initiation factor IIE alpha subunit
MHRYILEVKDNTYEENIFRLTFNTDNKTIDDVIKYLKIELEKNFKFNKKIMHYQPNPVSGAICNVNGLYQNFANKLKEVTCSECLKILNATDLKRFVVGSTPIGSTN